MTAKEFVKQHYPKARAERQVQDGRVKGAGKPYWLIRPELYAMYIASGTSESNAWVNAKKFIQEVILNKSEVDIGDNKIG